MAMKLNAGDVGRQDVFLIDPAHIIVDEGKNGRRFPHGSAEVAALAKSFAEDGQLQPVQVRRIEENKVELVLGYRRYRAACLYNETHGDKPMKLKCIAVVVNEEEAFRRNIVENRQRAETTPIDDAYNQRRLRDEYGWTDTKIADFYSMSGAYVCNLKKLLTLDGETQAMVHERKLSVQAALALAALGDEEKKEVMQEVKAEAAAKPPEVAKDGKPAAPAAEVKSSEVIRKVRERKIDNGKAQARSLKDVREFLEGLTGPAEPMAVKTLAENLLQYIKGKIKDDEAEKVFRSACKESPAT